MADRVALVSEVVERITQALHYAGWGWVARDGALFIRRDDVTFKIVITEDFDG